MHIFHLNFVTVLKINVVPLKSIDHIREKLLDLRNSLKAFSKHLVLMILHLVLITWILPRILLSYIVKEFFFLLFLSTYFLFQPFSGFFLNYTCCIFYNCRPWAD